MHSLYWENKGRMDKVPSNGRVEVTKNTKEKKKKDMLLLSSINSKDFSKVSSVK